MDSVSDLEWIDSDARPAPSTVTAAKLHVLHLEPIKAKLGEKWERLSDLVHKLFEKTLHQTQGPRDHFLRVDEMSYVVTFHDLSVEAADLACASVAQKVCELLFGSDIDDIAVRSLVGQVSNTELNGKLADAARITEVLERQGKETIVTPKSIDPGWRAQEMAKAGLAWIGKARAHAHAAGIDFRFYPIWDLKNRKSASFFCSAFSGADRAPISARRVLLPATESHVLDMEIALLNAAAGYAQRVHAAQKVCALGVGVSYETLSGFHSRIHYIGALKAAQTVATCPLLLRVEQVPIGTPLGRLAEMVAMLQIPNVRLTVAFHSLRNLPQLDVRLGAVGLGASLKNWDGGDLAAASKKLARRAADQKAFAFLHDIDSEEMLAAAAQNGIRFGSGRALDQNRSFSGEEAVPDLPLQL